MAPNFIKFDLLLWLLRRCSVALKLRAWLMDELQITERFLTGTCSAYHRDPLPHLRLPPSVHMRPTSMGS